MAESYRLPPSTLSAWRLQVGERGLRLDIPVPPLTTPDAACIAQHLPPALAAMTNDSAGRAELTAGLGAVGALAHSFDRIGCVVWLELGRPEPKQLAKLLDCPATEAQARVERWSQLRAKVGDFYTLASRPVEAFALTVPARSRSSVWANLLAVHGTELFGSLCNGELALGADQQSDVLLRTAYDAGLAASAGEPELLQRAAPLHIPPAELAAALGRSEAELARRASGYGPDVAPPGRRGATVLPRRVVHAVQGGNNQSRRRQPNR